MRIYYEVGHTTVDGLDRNQAIMNYVPDLKLGLAYFPGEVLATPVQFGHTMGLVVQQSEFEKGGHFAAFEMPDELAGDVRKMFRKGGPAYGVVSGRDGY